MTDAERRRAVLVIGSYLSPYVRKVLVCLDFKRIPSEIDPRWERPSRASPAPVRPRVAA